MTNPNFSIDELLTHLTMANGAFSHCLALLQELPSENRREIDEIIRHMTLGNDSLGIALCEGIKILDMEKEILFEVQRISIVRPLGPSPGPGRWCREKSFFCRNAGTG